MKAYLLLYNIIQLLGWSWLLISSLIHGPFELNEVKAINCGLKTFQMLMILDIVHALLKLTPSPPLTSAMQIFSRIWVVFGVMSLVPKSFWSFTLIFAWGTAEIIRYSNYAYAHFKAPGKLFTWIRYSGFIVLYPIGVFSELAMLYQAYPTIQKCCPRVFSFEMPNEYNFSFDYLYFIWLAIIPGYIVGFPFLYSYMLNQRSRKLKLE